MINYIKKFFSKKSSLNSLGGINFPVNSSSRSVVQTSSSASVHFFDQTELFFQNPFVHRAISLISDSIASMRCEVYLNDQLSPDSSIAKILQNPAYDLSFANFLESLVINYLLYGNSFIFLDSKNNLINLDSNAVKVAFDANKKNIFYEVKINGEIKKYNNNSFPLIGHLKNFNPATPLKGVSALDPIKNSANLYNYIDLYNLSLISKGGRASGIVVLNNSELLSDDDRKKLTDSFMVQSNFSESMGKVFFLNGDCKWIPLSDNSKDLYYNEASKRSVRAISAGLGIPSVLMGDSNMPGESSFSNIESAFAIFNKTTVFPLANKIALFLSNFFSKIEDTVVIKLKLQNGDEIK